VSTDLKTGQAEGESAAWIPSQMSLRLEYSHDLPIHTWSARTRVHAHTYAHHTNACKQARHSHTYMHS